MDEWFNPIDISQHFKAAKQWLHCTNKHEHDQYIKDTGIR
jgi:hypothetical protein